jgi:predicted kinase
MSGLPATGKSTIARMLAREIGAVHLRIDVIEHAVVESGLAGHPLGPWDRDHVIVDTAAVQPGECVARLRSVLRGRAR